jgi:23S rRNA (cytidine1920-2'-O)/16S rRNA (cytidine1409-2'-O)-methyltransferase
MRLDLAVAARFGITRNKARQSIEAGHVRVNGKPCAKPSADVTDSDRVELDENPATKYVSRAALKLKGLLEAEKLSFSGLAVLDVGASTGGFTQVALESGARKVWAVDVGSGQLDPRVAADPRVVNLEKTDVREAHITEKAQAVVADVSFVALDKLLPDVLRLAQPAAPLALLYKPQFQVGRAHVGKNGVVRDEGAIRKGLESFRKTLETSGCRVRSVRESCLPGETGNREWFFLAEAPAVGGR